ncbi:hypothetical protein Pelo_19431 [Pelomyxa schiedti]|nr:hypothetical protein Pelo_19431 [Pelomyxa schiedti]
MRGTGGGSDNICAKCGKTVYDREKLQYGPRKVYHKLCFTCSDCGKRIDLSSHQTANEMPYCKACFPKHSGVHLKH